MARKTLTRTGLTGILLTSEIDQMTSELYAQNNGGFNVYNVMNYGAVHDNDTDDTMAIQAAINAAFAAGGGIVYFPNGVYKIAGELQHDISGEDPNCQIYIPDQDIYDATRCKIKLLGEASMATGTGYIKNDNLNMNIPAILTGVILRSTLTSGFGGAVIGGKGSASFGSIIHNFIYADISIENFIIRVVGNPVGNGPEISGINASYFGSFEGKNLSVDVDSENVEPKNNVYGIAFGRRNCELLNSLERCTVTGFRHGIVVAEHGYLNNIFVANCFSALTALHGDYTITVGLLAAHWCTHSIFVSSAQLDTLNNNGFAVGTAKINIQTLEIEKLTAAGLWNTSTHDISDLGSNGYGKINFHVQANGNDSNNLFSKTGGEYLRCVPLALTQAQLTITGSKANGEALASIIAKLVANFGLIDGTTV